MNDGNNRDKKNSTTDGQLLDHNYDGIQELDNMLPRWWLASFYLCIAFAGVYFLYYELGTGQSIDQEFRSDVDALEAMAKAKSLTPFPDFEKLTTVQKNPESLKKGHDVFQMRCISCHGDHAQGLIGPNLTDDYWLHGDGKIGSVAKTVHDGVPEKGMPPWGPILSEDEVYAVTAFIKSLRGSNPASAKAPQGQIFKN